MIQRDKYFTFIVYLTITMLFLIGCVNNQKCENPSVESLFKRIKTIKIDSLRRINAFDRGPSVRAIRYYSNDCNYTQFLLKKEEDQLKVRVGDEWIMINNIDKYYNLNLIGISKNRLIYNFNVFEELCIDEIGTNCEHDALSIKYDTITFYYVFDSTYYKKIDTTKGLKNFGDNWWGSVSG